MDKPPKLTRDVKKKQQKLRPWLCKIIGHTTLVDVGYIDSHGNDDSLAECPRCGALDPDWPWWRKLFKK